MQSDGEWPAHVTVIAGDPASTVLLHVPHAARRIPADVRAGIVMDDRRLAAELDAMTDARTDEITLAAAAGAQLRPHAWVNRLSRLVIELLAAARAAFAHYEHRVNQPFAGTYVPLDFYGSDPRVQSLMVEIRRDQYDAAGVDSVGIQQLGDCLAALVEELSD